MRYAPAVLFTVGVGGAIGMLGWVLAGRPEEYMWSAFACGIATTAIFLAGALWRLRAALRAAWLGPVAEADRADVYDTDRPSFSSEPGTAAERTADLKRCYLGYITIDDYLDRWAGREIVVDEARDAVDATDRQMLELEIRAKIIGEILDELRRPGVVEEEPVSGVTPYFEAEAAAKYVPGFDTGDKVRLLRSDRIATLKTFQIVVGAPRRWTVEFGGSEEQVYEVDFVLALPKDGEVWNSKECYVCAMKWQQKWPECVTNVNYDWPDAPATRARISCGCLYRIGKQG